VKKIFSIKDKIAIVTGAAKGNGKVIADSFVEAGAVVYYIDILEDVVKNAGINRTKRSKSFLVDLTDENQVLKFIESIKSANILINNAGITLPPDESKKLVNWNRTISVNLTSVYNFSRQIAELMKKNGGGSIINITSISSYLGSSGNPSYHASKGGLRHLTKSLAADYARFNIRVNNICPGYIKTDMTKRSYLDRNKRKIISERTMLGRWGESQDLVGACIFLASEASSYITGTDILVDGGLINKGFDL